MITGSFFMDKFLRQHEIFLKKSESDLEAAKILLGSKSRKIDVDIVLFHMQQSAEKLLKCLLSYNRVHVEKVHDIEHLVSILRGNGITLPEYVDSLAVLTQFAVEGRYSVFRDETVDVGFLLKHLEEFRDFVKKQTTR